MINHDEFISKYKEFESVVREEYSSVKEYEDSLNEDDSKKLQLCRLIRNYIQHNVDYKTFVAVTPAMHAFLSKQIYDIECKHSILKDMMLSPVKYGCFFDMKTPVIDIANTLKKKKQLIGVVVEDDKVVGFVSKNMISDILASVKLTAKTNLAAVVSTVPLEKRDYVLVSDTTTMKQVEKVLFSVPDTIIVGIKSNKKGDKVAISGIYNV